MTDFTKGKWEVVRGSGNDEIDVISGDAPLHNHICVLFGYPTSRWNEQKANARLIAAAPDMYAFIKTIAEDINYSKVDLVRSMRCAVAEELIARIDGREAEA